MLPHIPSPRGPTVRFVMLPGATGIRLGCFWESHCGQAKLIFCSTLYQIYVHTFLVMDVPINVIIGATLIPHPGAEKEHYSIFTWEFEVCSFEDKINSWKNSL